MSWFNRHDHQMKLVSVAFNPPKEGWKIQGSTERLGSKLCWGFTLAVYRCAVCGEEEQSEWVGDHTKQIQPEKESPDVRQTQN